MVNDAFLILNLQFCTSHLAENEEISLPVILDTADPPNLLVRARRYLSQRFFITVVGDEPVAVLL